MEQVLLGASGLVVSEVCLGTNMFGGEVGEGEARNIVARFREFGGTFFDTAPNYNDGRSESLLGEILRHERDEVVIATKVYGATGPGPNDRSTSRRHILAAVDTSLQRLQTEYIDLYQLHRWDPTVPLEETLSTLDDLVRLGKVLYVGISNFVGWQIERSIAMQSAHGYDRFVALQAQYSLIERGIELEALLAARDHNLGVLAWSPLAEGFLAKDVSAPSDYSPRLQRRIADVGEFSGRAWDVVATLRRLAQEYELPRVVLAIAWILEQPGVHPVIGVSNPAQLNGAMGAVQIERSNLRDALWELEQVSSPERPYPYSGFPEVEGRPRRQQPLVPEKVVGRR